MGELLQEYLVSVREADIEGFFHEQCKLILKLNDKGIIDCPFMQPWLNNRRSFYTNMIRFGKQIQAWLMNQENPLEMLALLRCAYNVVNSKPRSKISKDTINNLEIIKDWLENLMDHTSSFEQIQLYITHLVDPH